MIYFCCGLIDLQLFLKSIIENFTLTIELFKQSPLEVVQTKSLV